MIVEVDDTEVHVRKHCSSCDREERGTGGNWGFLIFQSYRMVTNKGENNTFTRFQSGQKMELTKLVNLTGRCKRMKHYCSFEKKKKKIEMGAT